MTAAFFTLASPLANQLRIFLPVVIDIWRMCLVGVTSVMVTSESPGADTGLCLVNNDHVT